jgi:Na+-translocating ferredoxin:NAD+ oxidoreductase RNF subunit RnfB
MQCQICVEVCPFEAIKMDNDYEKSQYGRFDELVEHLPELLKPNEYYNRIKPTEASVVDAKLKADKEKKAKKAAPPAAPKPAAAPAPASKIAIPEDAPFTPEQREWLGKFLTTVPAGTAPSTAATPAGQEAAPAGDWPWHDPGMGMQQRLGLAKDKPIVDKLMAAMAQTDCHACGYDCRGYADAIAAGTESDLSLCLPGEAETENMLKKLMQEAEKL